MTNRIPIQSFYDILSKKYSQSSDWYYDMYCPNKKEIKYISKVFLKTIQDFASTLKIKKTYSSNDPNVPKIIYRNGIKFIKLPNQQNPIVFTNGNYIIFEKYILDLIKNDEIDLLSYIFENKIFDLKYFFVEKKYRYVEDGIFNFINIYVDQYIYFSLMSYDNNIKIDIEPYYNKYSDEVYIYKHNFNFHHKKLNENISKKLNYIFMHDKYSKVSTPIVKNKIIEGTFDSEFLNEYRKFCLRKIYYTFWLIKKFSNEDNFDEWVYHCIKSTMMEFFRF